MSKPRLLAALLLIVLLPALVTPRPAAGAADAGPFTITVAVTAGQGTIDTIDPVNPVPLGAAKHYRIRPARGWMISNVQVDGRSIGPSMYASFPFVRANHTVQASFAPFNQAQATAVSTRVKQDVRILIVGSEIAAGLYLEQMLNSDPTREFNVTIGYAGSVDYTGLLGAYYGGRGVSDLLPTIAEGWDYIIPFELYDQQADTPELHMEAVRLLYNRGWFTGRQARLILPMRWSYQNPTDRLDRVIEHTYRIAAGFRIPVVPCGIGWSRAVAEQGLPAEDTTESFRYGAYTCAALLYAQLFERDPAAADFTPAFTNGAFPLPADAAAARKIEQVAWATWQAERTRTHYTGAYSGNATPFLSNGGLGYHFGTSTRDRSVDQIPSRIGQFDPQLGTLAFHTSQGFDEVASPGSAAQAALASNRYVYMWRQDKESDSAARQYLNTYVRGQYRQSPYFIWFSRYADVPADLNADQIGARAWRESNSAFDDNQDTGNNPGRKSRAPLSHIGWGRIWEERTDIQMMEDDLLHAAGPVMSMFTAQTYALITGRDASRYGSWGYTGSLAEQAHYAERVGFTTIMQGGTLDINEPYEQSAYDVPAFNPSSVFYTQPATLYAQDDEYVIPVGTTQGVTISGPGVLSNDISAAGKPITAVLKSEPGSDSFSFQPNGSFSVTMPPSYVGVQEFTYAVSDGTGESNIARVRLRIVPIDVVATAQPGQPTTLSYSDPGGGAVSVQIPAGALSQATQLIFKSRAESSGRGGLRQAGISFTLTGYRNFAEVAGLTFQQPVTITITYTDADVAGIAEDELQVFFYDPARGTWADQGITVTARDPANNQITAQITHLTEFGLGTINRLYLPIVRQ